MGYKNDEIGLQKCLTAQGGHVELQGKRTIIAILSADPWDIISP